MGDLMRTIAFLTQKGGAGKTTLAASLAVAAAGAGERVIVLDLDPQASLLRWGKRREAENVPSKVMIEQLESERLPRLRAVLEGLNDAGFTLAVLDTAGADGAAARLVTEAVDLCLLPARPTRLDVEATAATFRACYLAKRRAAFVLNQCPPTHRSSRASDAAKDLTRLGVLAEPLLSARIDFQDAIAAGLGVTEYARGSRAAQEVEAFWSWVRVQLDESRSENPRRAAA
jgi:chromosome partitioning protein